MEEPTNNSVPKILTPKEQVIEAEHKYMRAHSRYVNTFNPTDALSNDMDNAANILNDLYEQYPQCKPQPVEKPLP